MIKEIIIFGNGVRTPEGLVEAVKLNLEASEMHGRVFGLKNYHLKVIFSIGEVKIEEKLLIATGFTRSCLGNMAWFNKRLFELLEKDGFSEDRKGELAAFLLNKYNQGKVTEKDMIEKIKEIFGVKP